MKKKGLVSGVRVAVIGAGVIGLATTAALLERDVDVVCYERLLPMAERSAGESRIFRLAHREAALVDHARQARQLWAGWERQANDQLIDPVGVVVSSENTHQWSEAMSAAEAAYVEVGPDSELLRLPTRTIPAQSVIDPAGGVIRVDRIGAFLVDRCRTAIRAEHVYALENDAAGVVVRSSDSQERYDAVVLCAGAGAAALAVQVGLYPPIALEHHARFTFRLRPDADLRPQCWISTSADGLATYQHLSAPGQWVVGASADPADAAWEVGAERALQAHRDITTAYVKKTLSDVDSEVIDQLYCTVNPGLGDGVQFLRNERVLVVYGDNIFKFAPLIGDRLAHSVVDGSLPTSMGSPQ